MQHSDSSLSRFNVKLWGKGGGGGRRSDPAGEGGNGEDPKARLQAR